MNLKIRDKLTLSVLAIVISSLAAAYISFYNTRDLRISLLISLLVALVLLAIFNFWVFRAVFYDVREIVLWVKSIAAGDFSKRVAIPDKDELGRLEEAMNQMSRRLQSGREESVAEKSRLEAVFLSMFDGIMVIDRRGAIVLMNQTLHDYLGIDIKVAGKKLLEVIRHIDIQEIAESVLTSGKRLESREIAVTFPIERVLLVHATPVLRDNIIDGAVLAFHDITELRRLENVRKDFVANVSHELRTPVATIRGYAETLLEGALEDKEHAREFVKIIHDDAERLTKLINEILDLSRIESGTFKLTLEAGALEPVIDRVLSAMQAEAQKHSVELKKEIPADLSKVKMQETAIAQVLFNLLENAIKYNKPGGHVTITACQKPRHVEVIITDTGIGIPEEELSRIFERFYRVDKAHSRQLGGTGLGLSIVKHIIQAHHSEITVESKPGSGSTFRFMLPRVL